MLDRIKKLFHIVKTEPEENKDDYINKFYESLEEDTIRLEIGEDLCKFADLIVSLCNDIRIQIKDDNGFILPLIRIIDNKNLQENQFRIILREDFSYDFYTIPNETDALTDIQVNLESICLENIETIFSSKVLEGYVNIVNKSSCYLVWDLFRVYTENDIKNILVNLIKKGHSIKNITNVFEKINHFMLKNGDWNRVRTTSEIVDLICKK